MTMMYFLSLIYIFMNKVTCYQRLVQTIVEDARNGMNFDYEMAAFPGFERRGHSESEFRDWVKTVKWVLNILNTHDGSLNQKKDFCRQRVSAAGVYKVPFYRLREEELQIIASAERFGRGDAGEVLRYGDRNVVSYDYRHIPCHEDGRKDILLVFSGAPESATKAAEAVYLRPRHGGIGMPEGRDVFVNACHYMVKALEEVTRAYGKTIHDINWISSHQANQRIIKTIARQTDIPEERFLMNIEQRGNTGSPSCAISLSENIHKVKPGDLVGLTVFGGGYSCGAVLLQY